ncbi:MAG: type III-B CRISPR-associated protein Cas10/Cmr2 [Pleurocapsa sp.]
MTELYWQAKIWGLLHDPGLKALSQGKDFAREGQWEILNCMAGWHSPKDKSALDSLSRQWLDNVGLCDLIASASDRSTIGRLDPKYSSINYGEDGLQIHHLLSGKPQTINISQWHERLKQGKRKEFLEEKELAVLNLIKHWEDPRQVHWWLWRCYPDLLAKDNPEVYLLPAETRFPDASLWSHTSITSALAGGLAGCYKNPEEYPSKGQTFTRSRPHLVVFTFSPVQELVKASRKMRDFWAGSWLLHYLSAKVSWELAKKYGVDTLLYPCLYQQPLIDRWLLQEYPQFSQWIEQPTTQQLLTAGFPNVIVMILPDNGKQGDDLKDNPIYAATQYAKQILEKEWEKLGQQSLEFLQTKVNPAWKNINQNTWEGWLKSQWQTYWTALPIGNLDAELAQSPRKEDEYQEWCDKQNDFTNLKNLLALFETNEAEFLKAVFNLLEKTETDSNSYSKQPNLNVGSWWGNIFDRLRYNLTAVKNARTWQMPTAFGTRSTISGIGSVVHNHQSDWVTEGQTKKFWSDAKNLGLFDGIEELNATEVVKRVLHKILPDILGIDELSLTYPDLSSGVAGWLKQAEAEGNNQAINDYKIACQEIIDKFSWAKKDTENKNQNSWGIPWINQYHRKLPNPRLINSGWLIEDFPSQDTKEKQAELNKLRNAIAKHFPPGNNPTDWYVIAAGDGDSMSEWLKGSKLKPYQEYIPQELIDKIDRFPDEIKRPVSEFLKVNKRMGPATHSALSRSLLDFANQLVPYLTESRYAGRLIYCGGDDILAYTNLWEWDSWLWDIRQCFKGQEDPQGEFESKGDYWQYKNDELGTMNAELKNTSSFSTHTSSLKNTSSLPNRPLFTLGSAATISFGVVIAHHSVPLAIALENLWDAEEEAKEHYYIPNNKDSQKDAVQVRAIYGNGNILKATAKFDVFNCWRELVEFTQQHNKLDWAIFESAAETWSQHPAPQQAIEQWTKAFCEKRKVFEKNLESCDLFTEKLRDLLINVFIYNATNRQRDQEIKNWLKLAAFTIRNRHRQIEIQINNHAITNTKVHSRTVS